MKRVKKQAINAMLSFVTVREVHIAYEKNRIIRLYITGWGLYRKWKIWRIVN